VDGQPGRRVRLTLLRLRALFGPPIIVGLVATGAYRGLPRNSMGFVILVILAMLATHQTLRFSQSRKCDSRVVVAANYAMAAVVCVAVVCFRAAQGSSAGVLGSITWRLVGAGVVNGALYYLHLLVCLACYRLVGVGITIALALSGLVVPVVVSWAAWGESLSIAQAIAVCLIPAAALLMRPGRKISATWNRKADVLLVLNVAMSGVIQTVHKAVSFNTPDPRLAYSALLFATACAAATATAVCCRAAPSRRDLKVGAVVGLFNCLTLLLLLAALNLLKAVVVLPTVNSAVICLSVVLSWIVWKESLRPRQVLGLAVALAAIVLANLSGNGPAGNVVDISRCGQYRPGGNGLGLTARRGATCAGEIFRERIDATFSGTAGTCGSVCTHADCGDRPGQGRAARGGSARRGQPPPVGPGGSGAHSDACGRCVPPARRAG